MSDTLIEFARPELVQEKGTLAAWRQDLLLAALIWNSVLVGQPISDLHKLGRLDRRT